MKVLFVLAVIFYVVVLYGSVLFWLVGTWRITFDKIDHTQKPPRNCPNCLSDMREEEQGNG